MLKALPSLRAEIDALGQSMTRGVGLDSPQFRAWLSGDSLVDPALGVTATEAWREPWVRKGSSVIARSLAWLPFDVIRRATPKKKTVVAGHWLSNLIANPNPFFGGNSLWKYTVLHMLIFGECFWWSYKTENAQGQPSELWIVDPRFIKPIIDYSQNALWPVVGWEIMVRGQTITRIDALDVVHFKYDEDPFQPWRGAGPLESIGLAVAGNIEASKYNVSFFRKGAKIAGVLETDKQLIAEKADDVRRRFMAIHRDPHQVAVLWGGMKYSAIASTQKDMEFSTGKDKNREEILGALGVPPVVVGVMDGASYANAFQQTKLFWTITMIPLAKQIASTAARFFLKREPGLECEFSTDGIEELRDELKVKSETMKTFFSVGMPYNDIVDLLDIRVPHTSWGDEGLVPIMITPAGALVDSALTILDEGGTVGSGTRPKEDLSGTATTPPKDAQPNADTTVNAVTAWTRQVTALAAKAQSMLTRAVPPARQIARGLGDDLLTHILLEINKDRDKLSTLSRMYYDRFFELGGQQMGDLLEISYETANYPAAVEFLRTKEIKIKDINDTLEAKIRETLMDGIGKGESTQELADRVRAVYNFSTSYGAKRIARTEASSTVNGARNIVMKQEGVAEREWTTAHDERVRDSHAEEDGHVVGMDEEYPVTGLKFPGDPDGEPEEIINCRCLELPVFSDEGRQARMMSKASRDLYWRTITFQYGKTERQFTNRLRRFFNDQRARVLEATSKLKVA